MKKFHLIMILLGVLLGSCLTAGAQERIKKVPSLTIGYAPNTTYSMDLARRSGNILFTFDPSSIHASVGLERQRKGIITLLELSYAKFNVKDYTDERDATPDVFDGTTSIDRDAFRPENMTSIQEISLLAGAGITINRQRRIQFPIYFLAGPGYLMGNDIHNITANVGAKARVKLYLTRSIGIWGGYTGHMSLALKEQQDEGYKAETFSMINFSYGPEFGMIFSF